MHPGSKQIGPYAAIIDVQHLVCRRYEVTLLDMLSQRRGQPLARYRQIAMWLCRHVTDRSLPQIGRRFGGRDHTTVMHAVRVIEGRCQDDPQFRAEMHALRNALLGDPPDSIPGSQARGSSATRIEVRTA